jgi:hypothetical protein
MLGEAGATVYVTGRSVRGKSAMRGRPETIEETTKLVDALGGRELQCGLTIPSHWGRYYAEHLAGKS